MLTVRWSYTLVDAVAQRGQTSSGDSFSPSTVRLLVPGLRQLLFNFISGNSR